MRLVPHRHPLDQRDRFLVNPRLASGLLGFVPPEELEPAAVPFEQGIRFDDQQRLFPMRQAAGQHDQQEWGKKQPVEKACCGAKDVKGSEASLVLVMILTSILAYPSTNVVLLDPGTPSLIHS